MKKIISIVVLLILPVLFSIFLQKYKNALGEYYLGRNYDPSYPYLVNSLNLAQFKGYGVGLIAHPGTPVSELGAMVLLVVHNMSSGNDDIVSDVLSNPEYYLEKIFKIFLLLNSIAIFLLGITVYRKMNSLGAALFLQLTPFSFFSEDIFFQLTNFSVEPVLVFILLLLITLIVSYFYQNESEKSMQIYAAAFGMLCGLGLATKISFFPVMIIPFLLIRKVKFNTTFLLITVFIFILFVFPAFSSKGSGEFFTWVRDLAAYSGKYGKGSENIVETSYFMQNIKSIFSGSLIFSISYFLLLITFMLQFFEKFKILIRSSKYFYLMTGILIAMTIQILIVAKHFSLYYMLPAFMFSVLGLFIINSILLSYFTEFFKDKSRYKYYFAVISVLISVLFFFHVRAIRKTISPIGNGRNEARKIIKSLDEEYKNSIVVSTYECSGKQFALYLGCFFGGTQYDRYMKILKEKNPNNFYYNRWDNNFYDVWDDDYIKSQLLRSNKFIFQGVTEEVTMNFMKTLKEMTNKPDASFKKIMSNYSGEALYEITLE